MGEEPKKGVNTGNRGKGRPKGAINKITADLRAAILEAAEAAGGREGTVGYLKRQAIESPASFLTLLGKVLPTVVAGDQLNPILHVIERRIVNAKAVD